MSKYILHAIIQQIWENMNIKYTNWNYKGIGKAERKRLSEILRNTTATVTALEASNTLQMSRQRAAKLLAMYAKKGWLSRIKQGVYIPVPIESETSDIVPEDEFVIAEKLFSPCYISGWSAAEYWGMTDQIFRSIIVMTQQQQKNYQPVIKGTEYLLHLTKPERFFGLRNIWRNNIKVLVSDPTRTIVDIIQNPSLCGGIRSTLDILQNYFFSKEKSIQLCIEYMQQLNNGAVYKRFGYLIEKYFATEQDLLNECKKRLTAGNAKLDSDLTCNKLVTKWRLLVPENWK